LFNSISLTKWRPDCLRQSGNHSRWDENGFNLEVISMSDHVKSLVFFTVCGVIFGFSGIVGNVYAAALFLVAMAGVVIAFRNLFRFDGLVVFGAITFCGMTYFGLVGLAIVIFATWTCYCPSDPPKRASYTKGSGSNGTSRGTSGGTTSACPTCGGCGYLQESTYVDSSEGTEELLVTNQCHTCRGSGRVPD
jgi:hypothetical protein